MIAGTNFTGRRVIKSAPQENNPWSLQGKWRDFWFGYYKLSHKL
jgi:hypothetical protein